MAAESKVACLPHELMPPTPPPSPCSPAPENNTDTFDLTIFSHEIFPRYKTVSKFNGECSIHLRAKLSAKSKDPSIYVHFSLKDQSKLLQISRGRHLSYFFDCPLIDKPFAHNYTTAASQFCPLRINTDDYPVRREHMRFFEIQIYQFIKELLESNKCYIRIDAKASINSVVVPDEVADIVKEMEGNGFREDSYGDAKCYDYAVCLDNVRLGWFRGMRFPCGHVFHAKCISRWFDRKSSWPMCRQEVL